MRVPHISIIVPIYNVEAYLDECLKSIYDVVSESIEIILVNDSSTDTSLMIAEKYLNEYPHKTKLTTRVNGGLSAARNTGLDLATGEWIYFLDSDDFVDDIAFTKVLELTKRSNSDIIAFTGYIYMDDTRSKFPLHKGENPFSGKGPVDSRMYHSKMLELGVINVSVWDKFYRRSLLNGMRLRFIEGLLHEDVPFTFSALVNHNKIEFFPEHVIFYRQRAGSIMSTNSVKKSTDKIRIANILLDFFEEKQINDINFNNYLVHLVKSNNHTDVITPRETYKKIFFRKLSVKKRLILIYCALLNVLLTLSKFKKNKI